MTTLETGTHVMVSHETRLRKRRARVVCVQCHDRKVSEVVHSHLIERAPAESYRQAKCDLELRGDSCSSCLAAGCVCE